MESAEAPWYQALHAGPSAARPTTPSAALPVGAAERDRLLRELRRLEPELRRRGMRRLCLFGSVARAEADAASDIDLLAELDCTADPGFSLLDLIALQHFIGDELGPPRPDPDRKAQAPLPRPRAIEADAIEVFGAAA